MQGVLPDLKMLPLLNIGRATEGLLSQCVGEMSETGERHIPVEQMQLYRAGIVSFLASQRRWVSPLKAS